MLLGAVCGIPLSEVVAEIRLVAFEQGYTADSLDTANYNIAIISLKRESNVTAIFAPHT